MNYLQIILQFLLSGGVVVGATLLAKHLDSKWSGLLVALPAMTILGFIFITLNTDQATSQRYLISAALFMIPAATYIISLYILYPRTSIISSLIISIIPFGIVAYLIQKLIP